MMGRAFLALLAVVGLMIVTNFDWFFYQFHLLSFANDFWQLDPTRDYLIMLFPQGFWFDVTLLIAITTAVLAVVVIVQWIDRTTVLIKQKQSAPQSYDHMHPEW